MNTKSIDLQLLTLKEAEQITGRKVATWRKDILLRKIPYVKIGRQVRIPMTVIKDLVTAGFHPSISSD